LPGFHCASNYPAISYYPDNYCGDFVEFACQMPGDECMADADCLGLSCNTGVDARYCNQVDCGRPFLVDERARVAGVCERDDWTAGDLTPACEQLDVTLRRRLAQEWTRAGQFEHASIAAFARFMLELLAFGAPAELVAEAARAIDDERRHATLCFALASAYGGRAIGPDALDVDDAMATLDLGQSLATTILEGCIGETVAALEAAELAQRVDDPILRGVLEGIAGDEKRHAALAFKFVKWALARRPELVAVVVREIERVNEESGAFQPPTNSPALAALARAGIAPGALKAQVRVAALRGVVQPGLRALLEEVSRRGQGCGAAVV
jgi:hypothetical protein